MQNNGLKLIDLRPNRSLLNSNFEGYKLSLNQIPTVAEELKVPVDRLLPDTNEYSLLHTKLYAFHNHLISDEAESVYFVDRELNIQKYSVDAVTNQFTSAILWKVPLERERSPGDLNVSLKFASDKIAAVADGMGYLYILDQGIKELNEKWKVVFSGNVTGAQQKYLVTDVVYKETQKPQLHLLLTSIRQRTENERYSTILHWVTLEKTESWNQTILREITVNGFIQYANLEHSCEAVHVVSDTGSKFTLDSENEIHESLGSEVGKRYEWNQDEKEITMKLTFLESVPEGSIDVNKEENYLSIKYRNEILMEGELYQQINQYVTSWSGNNTVFKVVLQKAEIGLMWPEVLKKATELASMPSLGDEVIERLERFTSEEEAKPPSGITFNSQQVEECDFECDSLSIYERLSCNSHKITHKVNLGSHKVLLTVKLDRDAPLALGLRNDVDTCIWQPVNNLDDFNLEHKGTLLALGYIQASKQQMKFFFCTPDLSHSFICESTRHVFIYCQQKSIMSNELRNRVTGRRISTMAQQQLYTLPTNDEILGVYASNAYLYILVENFITVLKL